MKKMFFIVIVLLSLPLLGQKQHIGIYGGINTNRLIDLPKIVEREFLLGSHFGLNYSCFLNDNFFISTQIGFVQKGDQIPVNMNFTDNFGNIIAGYKFDISARYHYLDLALEFGYLYALNAKNSLYTSVGLSPDIFITANIKYGQGAPEEFLQNTSDIENVKRIDFGAILRLGYRTQLFNKLQLDMNISSTASLLPIWDKKVSGEYKPKHFGGLFSIGVLYQL